MYMISEYAISDPPNIEQLLCLNKRDIDIMYHHLYKLLDRFIRLIQEANGIGIVPYTRKHPYLLLTSATDYFSEFIHTYHYVNKYMHKPFRSILSNHSTMVEISADLYKAIVY